MPSWMAGTKSPTPVPGCGPGRAMQPQGHCGRDLSESFLWVSAEIHAAVHPLRPAGPTSPRVQTLRIVAPLCRYNSGYTQGRQFNGIATFQSGTPISVASPLNNTYIFSGQRPNSNGRSAHISGGPTDARLAQWFDTSTFSVPADYTFGNVGRTLPDVRNPGARYADLSLFKNFGLLRNERARLQYRLKAFGATNSPVWGGPGGTLASGTYGVITSSTGERQLQMALKLIW
jgi:hypothetical protein